MKPLIVFFCLTLATAGVLFGCGKVRQEKKIYQIGIVNFNHQVEGVIAGFKQGMEKKGYIEGVSVRYNYPGPLDTLEQGEQLIGELVAGKVDLIYTITTPATRLASKLTAGTEIPIVFGPMMSPLDSGLVTDLFSPDNTITGVRVRGSVEKSLYYLKEIKPDLKNIYVPFHVGNSPARVCMHDLRKAARKFGVQILSENVHDKEEVVRALGRIPAEAEAIWLSHSHLLVSLVAEFVKAGNRLKIPIASPVNQLSDGVLVNYASTSSTIGRQVSRLADKLLRGAKPASLPIETAEFFLGINLKVADFLGLEVPQYLVNQADSIIR